MLKQVWIVKGTITDDVHGPAYKIGDTEWQVSDGPAGKRSGSADFPTLEAALEYASGCIIHFDNEV